MWPTNSLTHHLYVVNSAQSGWENKDLLCWCSSNISANAESYFSLGTFHLSIMSFCLLHPVDGFSFISSPGVRKDRCQLLSWGCSHGLNTYITQEVLPDRRPCKPRLSKVWSISSVSSTCQTVSSPQEYFRVWYLTMNPCSSCTSLNTCADPVWVSMEMSLYMPKTNGCGADGIHVCSLCLINIVSLVHTDNSYGAHFMINVCPGVSVHNTRGEMCVCCRR